MVFYTVGPNKVMVVTGACFARPRYIVGGRAIAIPIIHRVQKLPLSIFTLTIKSERVYTKNGVPVTVIGVAQVKVASHSTEILELACKQLLGKSKREIQQVAQETVEGHQRAIMGLMTVEEIITDRKSFAEKVFDVTATDLVNLGFTIVSYTLKSIQDSEGYLKALGEKRTAEVKKQARIGEAKAKMESTIKEAEAEEAQKIETFKSEMGMARAKRDFELEKAGYDTQINAAKARAELAYQLASAQLHQLIKEEEMNVEVVEREQAIALMKQETLRRERELDATVRQPASAAKFQMETGACAERERRLLEAQADAAATKMQGDADAEVTRLQGAADALQMKERAAAFLQYGDAALIDMYLQALPKIAAEVASNLTKDGQSLKLISVGDGDVGMARFVQEVNNIVMDLPRLVHTMAGVDVNRLNVSYPATGRQKLFEVDDDRKLRIFYDKRMGQEVDASPLGDEWKGCLVRIGGGNDKQGFPMKQGVLTVGRVRLLLAKGHTCYRPRRTGERKRKSVRGCIVDQNLSVLHLVIVKKGDNEIPGLTDSSMPRRLGPKRANKIRKMFLLSKQDDPRQYVVRRKLPAKDGKKERTKAPKIQRLITPALLQRKRHRAALKRRRVEKAQKLSQEYHKMMAAIQKQKQAERAARRRSSRSKSEHSPKVSVSK